jgi:protease-4
MDNRDNSKVWSKISVVLALISLTIAASLGYIYLIPKGENSEKVIGVIDIEGTIIHQDYVNEISANINEAINNPEIRGIVLRVNSPGGSSHLVEQIYLDLLVLNYSKPVVVSATTALSGGYHIAIASNLIYTTPTAMIGNVGVIGVGPGTLIPSESRYESGPQKITGYTKTLFPYNLSQALHSFSDAVILSRGDRLKLSKMELTTGKIYLGDEAVREGLVDGIGSLQVAADKSAELAGIDDYYLKGISSDALAPVKMGSFNPKFSLNELSMEKLNELNPPPATYYLYLPEKEYLSTQAEVNITVPDENTTEPIDIPGHVLVDLSHGNKVSPWIFDSLQAQLAGRGVTVGYSSDWNTTKESLEYASCLIIAAPTDHYSYQEFKDIHYFVKEGRLLIFFYDPSAEFNSIPNLLGPINSITKYWGLSFSKGYLYNQEDCYGIYRNIYIRRFENKSITQGLDEIVFFTSTHLHPTDSDAAHVPSGTYSSVAEREGEYPVFSILDKGEGIIAAFGDITWLLEPYVYIEDNFDLLMNLVNEIKKIDVTRNNSTIK